jgi:hypothetical protein
MSKEAIVGKLVDGLIETFNKEQEKDFQYAVAYIKKSDGSLIGYHASTFCQITEEKTNGKRYSGDNPYNQLGVIHKNITSVLSVQDGENKIFSGLMLEIKKRNFEGLTIDDIVLEAHYLDEGIPKQTLTVTKVE